MNTRTDYEAMLRAGCEAASKATSCQGEYDAWEAVGAQFIDVLTDTWRPPAGTCRLLEAMAKKRQARAMNTARGTEGDYRSRPDTSGRGR